VLVKRHLAEAFQDGYRLGHAKPHHDRLVLTGAEPGMLGNRSQMGLVRVRRGHSEFARRAPVAGILADVASDHDEDAVLVRRVTEHDVPEMRAVHARSWLATYPSPQNGVDTVWVREVVEPWSSAESIAQWVEIVKTADADPDQFSRAAKVRGRLVGLLHAVRDANGRIELTSIYVDPDWFGTGVGTALMAAFDAWAGGAEVRLDVASYNERAIGFYAHHGFAMVPNSPRLELGVIPVVDMIRPANGVQRKG